MKLQVDFFKTWKKRIETWPNCFFWTIQVQIRQTCPRFFIQRWQVLFFPWQVLFFPTPQRFVLQKIGRFCESLTPRPQRGNHVDGGVQRIYMGVSKNRGFSPQIIHFNRVFHDFHHPFWVPLFLETPIY